MALFGTEYGKQSDERLMELVVRGDEKAFAALYDRYQPVVELLPPHAVE
jgi:hypothetical protein